MESSEAFATFFTGGMVFVFFIVVSLIVFLICRELVCWYWKINASLKVQREIASKLDEITKLLQMSNYDRHLPPAAAPVTPNPTKPDDPV